jgi:hypothetical protein
MSGAAILNRGALVRSEVAGVAEYCTQEGLNPDTLRERCDAGAVEWIEDNRPALWTAYTSAAVGLYLQASGLSPAKAADVFTLERTGGDAWSFPPDLAPSFRDRWRRVEIAREIASALWPAKAKAPDPEGSIPLNLGAPAELVDALRERAASLREELAGLHPNRASVYRIPWAFDAAGVMAAEIAAWHEDARPYRMTAERVAEALGELLGDAPTWTDFLRGIGWELGDATDLIREELGRRAREEAEKEATPAGPTGGIVVHRIAANVSVPSSLVRMTRRTNTVQEAGADCVAIFGELSVAEQAVLWAALRAYSSSRAVRGRWEGWREIPWDVWRGTVGLAKGGKQYRDHLAALDALEARRVAVVERSEGLEGVARHPLLLSMLFYREGDTRPTRTPEKIRAWLHPALLEVGSALVLQGDIRDRLELARRSLSRGGRVRADSLDFYLAVRVFSGRQPDGTTRLRALDVMRDFLGEERVERAVRSRNAGKLEDRFRRSLEVLEAAGWATTVDVLEEGATAVVRLDEERAFRPRHRAVK